MGKNGLVNRYNMTKYLGKPFLVEKELKRTFGNGDFVFVQDMSDLFAEIVPSEHIKAILKVISNNPHTQFLLLSKNPKRYEDFLSSILENCIVGTTIETNRDTAKISMAPNPRERWRALRALEFPRKFVSIEPIMDFDIEELSSWIYLIPQLEMVAVGYDNYNNNLPEPPLAKTEELIERINGWIKVFPKTMRRAWWEKR